MILWYIYDSTIIYIIGNQLTQYFTVFVVLVGMESQGNSYWDVHRFHIGEVCLEFR
jgi:hypothetical protein